MTKDGSFHNTVSNWVRCQFYYCFLAVFLNFLIRFTLGIQLGVGCFGRVVKAEAVGIKRANEAVKTVAVKMVRSKNNFTALEALISELKILIYLGSHLNVVNLLGACTKNITKGRMKSIRVMIKLYPLSLIVFKVNFW